MFSNPRVELKIKWVFGENYYLGAKSNIHKIEHKVSREKDVKSAFLVIKQM